MIGYLLIIYKEVLQDELSLLVDNFDLKKENFVVVKFFFKGVDNEVVKKGQRILDY